MAYNESSGIAVDPAVNDSQSDYESDSDLSTESLAPSVYNYRWENGRRYHAYKDGKYALPNDEKEQDRLDILHHLNLLVLSNKLYLAPIGKNPQKVLDIGTGTGIWAIDMAESYPSAEVIGTDLSPIQPSWVPPNVQFQVDDAEADWTWKKNSFDFVHIRHLGGAIKDWERLVRQAFESLKPGGYIEVCEFDMNVFSDDDTYHRGLWLWKYYELINKAADKTGRGFDIIANIQPTLEKSGYEDVTSQTFRIPIGTWPADPKLKDQGNYSLLLSRTAFESYGMALFTRVLGMDEEKAREVITGAEKDVRNRKIHTYCRQHFWWARKPEVI